MKKLTKFEIDYIKNNYKKTSTTEMSKYLGISVEKIWHVASRLKIKKYKSWEDLNNPYKFCNKCNENLSIKKFRRRNNLGHTLSTICIKCDNKRRRGGNTVLQVLKWKKFEITLLRKLYKNGTPIQIIAKKLNRTEGSIYNKGYELKLTDRIKKISKKEIQYVKENFHKISIKELARTLNRTEKSIMHIASKLKLIFRRSTKIEEDIKLYLESQNIVFKEQKKIGKFWVDFLINNNVIEVNGSYWHADPLLYKIPINAIQIKNIDRDQRKKEYLLNKNYNLIVIWEYDLINNFEQICQELNVVLNSNIRDNDRAKSVELLRNKDNTEVTSNSN